MGEGLPYMPEEMRRMRPETGAEMESFTDLDLRDLRYGPGSLTKNQFGDPVDERRAERDIMLNGRPCKMIAVERHPPGKTDEWFSDDFQLENTEGEKGIAGAIYSSVTDGKMLVTTSIQRYSDDDWLRGAGVQLYEKMLDYLDKDYGARHGVEKFTHLVQRMPGFSVKKRLSDERWNEIFLPILEKRGYKDIGGGNFEKEYITSDGVEDTKAA